MLTQAHVRALRDHPSPIVRADIAAAVSLDFAAGKLNAAETEIAEDILEGLAQDVASTVRQALAENIRHCPFLPHNVAIILAHDLEESVAVPVIEYSPLLSDTDLISLIRTQDVCRQLAVARRKSLRECVTDELVEAATPKIAHVLLANTDAEISDDSLLKVALRFREDTVIHTLLIDRSLLPFSVCGLLMEAVSVELRARLVDKHQIPDFLANELVTLGRERALADLLPSYDTHPSENLAFVLQQRNLLTPTLILRALCLGDLRFFEGAMAVRAGLSLTNTRTLLYDWGSGGLRSLYRKAELPVALFIYFRLGIDAVRQGNLDRGKRGFTSHVIEEFILADGGLSPGTIDHILAELAHRATSELGN